MKPSPTTISIAAIFALLLAALLVLPSCGNSSAKVITTGTGGTQGGSGGSGGSCTAGGVACSTNNQCCSGLCDPTAKTCSGAVGKCGGAGRRHGRGSWRTVGVREFYAVETAPVSVRSLL